MIYKILFLLLYLNIINIVGCSNSGKRVTTITPINDTQRFLLSLRQEQIQKWLIYGPHNIMAFSDSIGDSLLYAGILCSWGIKEQCEAIKLNSCKNGMPARNIYMCDEYNGSSRDMLLGALLYIVTTKDVVYAQRLLRYIKNNNYTLCNGDDRCNIIPGVHIVLWGIMGEIWKQLKLPLTSEMLVSLPLDEHLLYLQSVFADLEINQEGVYFNDDYGLHLVSVEIWLFKKLKRNSNIIQKAIDTIFNRDSNNAWFEYLKNGATSRSADLVLNICPIEKPESQTQWIWKPPYEKQRWLSASGWDCVGLINLLLR